MASQRRPRRQDGRAARKVEATRIAMLEAAKRVLREQGYSGLSTREVAAAAGVPLSQIHYHFGSKRAMLLAVFEYQNAQLLDRQTAMYADPTLALSDQWDRACDYLDEDLKSGYVRVLMELWAAGWADPDVAKVVRANINGWMELLSDVARRAEAELGPLEPFAAEDVSALVGAAFIGAEAFLLLDCETDSIPMRRALRQVGAAIRVLEERAK